MTTRLMRARRLLVCDGCRASIKPPARYLHVLLPDDRKARLCALCAWSRLSLPIDRMRPG